MLSLDITQYRTSADMVGHNEFDFPCIWVVLYASPKKILPNFTKIFPHFSE